MATKTSSRSTSPRTPTHRPKLMRASITEPSLATSNASRNDLASLYCSSSRATTLLTRVASYSSAQHDLAMRRSGSERGIGSVCSSPGNSPRSAGSERKEPFEIAISKSGNYFSFPSFEEFQEYLESEDQLDGRAQKS